MANNASDLEVRPEAAPEIAQPGLEVQGGNQASRRKSTANRDRKYSVVDPNAAVVESHELSEADRRLAELGYVQVSSGGRPLPDAHPDVYDES